METLQKKISDDLTHATKERDEVRVSTLRLLSAGLHNREIEKKGKGEDALLSDNEVLELVRREAKKRKEAITLYRKGAREELASREERELSVLEEYLPAQAGEETIRNAIDDAIALVHPEGAKDFGKVMGAVMKALHGTADTEKVAGLIKEKLGV